MDVVELLLDLLHLAGSFRELVSGHQSPPKARPDDWTPPDVSEIVRIVGGNPPSEDNRPDAKILVRDSRPEGTSASETARGGDS